MTAAESSASLLGLPREIREQILTHYISSTHLRYTITRPTHFITTITEPYRYAYTDPTIHNILYVCKQVRDEARPLLLAEVPLQIPGNLHQFTDTHNLPTNIIEEAKHITMQDPGTVTTQPFRKADLDRFLSLETIWIFGNKDLSAEAFDAMIDRKSGLPPALRKLVFGPDWLPRFVELDRLLGKSVVVQGQVRFTRGHPGADAGAIEVRDDRVSIQ